MGPKTGTKGSSVLLWNQLVENPVQDQQEVGKGSREGQETRLPNSPC